MNESLVTIVGIAVVAYRGHYLVGLRGDESSLPGLSEFPGGKCRPAEEPAACAVRECAEETGVAVTAVEQFYETIFDYAHGRLQLHFWRCRPVTPPLLTSVHRGYRWMPVERLSECDFPEANAPVIAMLQSISP